MAGKGFPGKQRKLVAGVRITEQFGWEEICVLESRDHAVTTSCKAELKACESSTK